MIDVNHYPQYPSNGLFSQVVFPFYILDWIVILPIFLFLIYLSKFFWLENLSLNALLSTSLLTQVETDAFLGVLKNYNMDRHFWPLFLEWYF